MTDLLRVERLTKRYSTRREIVGGGFQDSDYLTAVDSVNFKVTSGEALGLVGQSGSGKTTIGKLILKLERPTAGHVLFEGEDVSRFRRRRLKDFRAKTQMIFQDPYESLDPRLPIRTALEEPLIVHGIKGAAERRERINEALRRVGLTPPERFLELRPHELSGGQRQRVAIARSLILEPKLVVADEPLSMLDVSVSAGILNLMLELRGTLNISFLFITHNLAHAAVFCDRVVVLSRGRIVEEGPTVDVLSNPKHDYTRTLIAAIPAFRRHRAG